MGPLSEHFWEKSDFSPWGAQLDLPQSLRKGIFLWFRPFPYQRGWGVKIFDIFFFAFLDELDHLEAKKKNSKISGF